MSRARFGMSLLLATFVGVLFIVFNQFDNLNKEYTTAELLQKRIQKKKGIFVKSNPKFDHPSEYFEYHKGIRTRENQEKPSYPVNYKIKELRRAKEMLPKNARTAGLQFFERGPFNTPGRSRSLIVDPEDINLDTWILGTVGGGIWKTTDGGVNWTNTSKDLPSLAVTTMDYCKSNPEVIYAGTGEAVGGSVGIIGSGVYKSVNGGDSWVSLSSTVSKEFSVVNRAAVHPQDPETIIICTAQADWDRNFRSSIFKSTDGGDSWAEVYESDKWVTQVIFNPENPNTVFATSWGEGIIKSTDGGNSWVKKLAGFHNVSGRVEVAVAPSDTSWIYASAVGDAKNANYDLYLSIDAGESWVVIDQLYENKRFDFLGGQGDYDHTVAVHPFNKEVVYIGGVDLWKTEILSAQSEQEVIEVVVDVSNGSNSFWDFVNFGADYFQGRLEIGSNLPDEQFANVIMITGPGVNQLAHRFTVNKKGSGVPDNEFKYQDYVEVPFQVWDIDNQRQLMVSFRDQQEDGGFTLLNQNTAAGDEENHSREYVYIHGVEYSETPNASIAQNGGDNIGHTFNQMYFFWPFLRESKSFDSANPEVDTINIEYLQEIMELRASNHFNVSDAYNNYDKKNNAYDTDLGQFIFHPDHHFLTLLPINPTDSTFEIFDCSDGGIYHSNSAKDPGINDGDWLSAGKGVISGQFYGADKKPGEEVYIGGMQDNGTWRSPDNTEAEKTTTYSLSLTGDGFEAIWHNTDPESIIASSQFNGFAKTSDGGDTWFEATRGLTGSSPFISKLSNSPAKPDILFTVTSDGVFKSTNFGTSWELTPITEKWGLTSFLDVDVSRINYNVVWAGSGMSATQNLHVSTDGGKTFNTTNNYDLATLGNISGLYAHPIEDSTAYALFSFSEGPKILRTTDLGQTWEDISGFHSGTVSTNGFPDVAVYDLLVRPDDPNILWAGTEIGIFESINNGETWTFLDSELGSVAVWQMKPVDDQIVIATHGRGIWSAMLDEFVEVTFTPALVDGGTTIEGDLYLRIDFNSPYDSTVLYADNNIFYKISSTGVKKDSLLRISDSGLAENKVYGINMVSYRNGKPFSSESGEVVFYTVGNPVVEYVNDFNNKDSSDFVGIGFSLNQPSGFTNFAIHSEHPYPEGVNYPEGSYELVYYLKNPVTVGERNTRFQYRDIAIIEIGDTGSKFGEENFYDYVVVEASLNGYDWISIANGYDANKQISWKNAFNAGNDGDPSLYIANDILLNSKFETGDELLFRFRLYTDPLSNGWGWSIDDLSIMEVPITGMEDDFKEKALVYPNPAGEIVNVKMKVPETQAFQFSLIDINGRQARANWTQTLGSGDQIFQIARNGLKQGVYFLRIAGLRHGEFSLHKIVFK